MSKKLVKAYKGPTRNYEIACIINQSLSQEAVAKKIEELKAIATAAGGKVHEAAVTNLKSYAYPINSANNKKGYYACLYTTMEPANVSEIARKISIQDDVLRVLTLLSDPSKQNNGIFAANYEDDSYKPRRKVFSYDDPNTLIKFLGERGRIEPRKQSVGRNVPAGIALKQRVISKAIKRSRFLSLLPYIEE